MNRSPGERGRRKLTRLWWSSLPLRILLTTFTASCAVLVLAGVLLVQQATAGIVATKRTASIREAVGMHHFMQGQLQNPERLGTATYEQLSRLVELAGAQAAQYLVIVEGPASVLSSSSGIGLDSVPPELRRQVTGREGMYIAATRVVMAGEGAGQPGLVVGTTLITSAGERFPVYYVFPMTSEVTTLRDIQRAVYTTGAALLLGLTAIAYLVTLQVVRPVRKAGRTARRLASGQLDERMPVRGTDDLASLALSMNEMASDLQQRIRELETLSTVQRRFVSDVSHELRTPMTTIKMASDLLHEERGGLPPDVRRTVELMNTEIERFNSMLADLLEISRFDAGAAVLDLDEVDVGTLVASEVQAQETFANSQGSELRLHVEGVASAQLDSRRIRRIVRNLLTNAIDHGEGRPIDVTVASDEEAVAVTVRDHGIGFQAELSSRVFDRFWRADPSRARAAGGTGLGLAISREDARLHRGWLSAWGRPGSGAQFRLTLPRNPEVTLSSSPLPVIPADLESRKDL
ncbi:MtrAB system histidine kinase MtrB [[Pseudopropionibacterium] massiliense]|uniref:MtrAB system histidine kinase MtrB n=1 Tax=[Pseudopropionibacterium] massiliense TaxID=2220000 RepID=UPI00102F9264|nr:MtrAB system histidine kinase MtrB [[Pseudopropionibacterium] massiliense]